MIVYMNSTKINPKIVDNAQIRSGVRGKQGLLYGAKGSRPDKLKPFSQTYYKKQKDLEDKPTKFKPAQVRENTYNATTTNMRGKRTDRDFNKTQPVRFDPMKDKDQNKTGNNSYNAGSFRGGEPLKEVGKYQGQLANFNTMKGGDYGVAKNVLPFPVKIKSNVNV